MMTPKQMYIEVLTFGAPERIPFMPGGPRESTLERWRSEGLPEGVDHFSALSETLGLRDLPAGYLASPGVDFRMMPLFEEKVLAHQNGHYIVQDWMGAITEISDRYDYTYIRSAKDFVTRKWHSFPVQTAADWDAMKKRYDPDAPARLDAAAAAGAAKAAVDSGRAMSIEFNGPFWQLREWCGFENLCILMAEDPDFVSEMSMFWRDFVDRTLDRVLRTIKPDHVLIQEDMAYKEHSMISPAMTREFLVPCYERWIPKLKSAGTAVIEMDSDGCVDELIPIWIECGINCTSPVEAAAGNDIAAFRRRYGREMAFVGGIDKRCIAAGGSVMRSELDRVVSPMKPLGGFIPSCDHGVPHDISWNDFIDYSRELARLTGWL